MWSVWRYGPATGRGELGGSLRQRRRGARIALYAPASKRAAYLDGDRAAARHGPELAPHSQVYGAAGLNVEQQLGMDLSLRPTCGRARLPGSWLPGNS